MSSKFEKVKRFYEEGTWKLDRVRNAVVKNWISKEEFEAITGIPYDL